MTHRLAVLISGSGTNLQAIITAIDAGQLNAEIVLVLSNRADAGGLQRAAEAGIRTGVIDHRDYPSRDAFDQAMAAELDRFSPDTVVLAGFMRVLSDGFVRHFKGRLINIHPSLLPRHRGLHTHRRALEAGDREHGCSIHFVSEELDGGPVIAQATVSVDGNDTEASLSNKVQEREHILYPLVLGWRAQGRLAWTDRGAELDGQLIPAQGLQLDQLDPADPVVASLRH